MVSFGPPSSFASAISALSCTGDLHMQGVDYHTKMVKHVTCHQVAASYYSSLYNLCHQSNKERNEELPEIEPRVCRVRRFYIEISHSRNGQKEGILSGASLLEVSTILDLFGEGFWTCSEPERQKFHTTKIVITRCSILILELLHAKKISSTGKKKANRPPIRGQRPFGPSSKHPWVPCSFEVWRIWIKKGVLSFFWDK